MSTSSAATLDRAAAAAPAAAPPDEARLRALFDAHYDLVWRSLKRFGVRDAVVDDAAQEVFLIASRRLDDIRGGSERAFLLGTAVRVAADSRRRSGRSREDGDDGALADVAAETPDPGELLDRCRAREILDRVLDAMEGGVRAVFVLFEIEGMTMAEIARALDLAPGTVASRLRRGREQFHAHVARLRARGGDA